MRRVVVGVGIALLALAAVGMRSIGFEHVFPDDREGVVLAMDDAQYHARRARYTFERFPRVLVFDPYLNHPKGAFVPWPPLYDFGLGGAARLLGHDRASLDLVLAWAPVVLGLLTALTVFAIGRGLGGEGAGLGAMALFAVLPATTHYSSVGNPDHHAAVAWLATLLLWGHLRGAAAGEAPARVWGWQALLVAARLAMLLTWHGSLLYVVLAESLALAVAAWTDRRETLLAQAVGCGLVSLLGFAALSLPHSQVGGAWSAVELSRLQPSAYAAFALTAALSRRVLGGGAGQGAGTSAGRRLAWTAGIGSVAGAIPLALAWDGLRFAWEYASRAEPYIQYNFESQTLWSAPGEAVRLYAWAFPLLLLAPLAGLWLARREALRGAGLLLAGWTAALLCLAISNARYASDFAPALCVSLALGGAALAGGLARALGSRIPAWPGRASILVVLGIAAVALAPLGDLVPHARRSLAAWQGHLVVVKRPGEGLTRSVYSFVDALRAATPDPGGGLDPEATPAYGVLAPPTLGFVVKALGERPTPAGNFGPYVGDEGLLGSRDFYLATRETEALRHAQRLRCRYVVTTDEGPERPGTMMQRLHHDDGSRVRSRWALRHFRLVTESPRRGVPLGALRGATEPFVDTPYKLFEIVPGAELVVSGGDPGRPVFVSVEIESGSGRRFVYRSRGQIGDDGLARVRVPYATDASTPARPVGPYRVRTDAGVHAVEVRESQVAAGESVRVP